VDRALLFYDEDCGFCRWSVAKILKWDRHDRIRAVPIQGPEGDEYLDGMSEEERLASWHLVTPDGNLYSSGAAVPHLAKLLPAGAPVAALASRFPGATESLYRWVARNRDTLGRRLGSEACAVDPSKTGR
jgi:predicted DCC family thiol-disulfide oxidoreductase YuxK